MSTSLLTRHETGRHLCHAISWAAQLKGDPRRPRAPDRWDLSWPHICDIAGLNVHEPPPHSRQRVPTSRGSVSDRPCGLGCAHGLQTARQYQHPPPDASIQERRSHDVAFSSSWLLATSECLPATTLSQSNACRPPCPRGGLTTQVLKFLRWVPCRRHTFGHAAATYQRSDLTNIVQVQNRLHFEKKTEYKTKFVLNTFFEYKNTSSLERFLQFTSGGTTDGKLTTAICPRKWCSKEPVRTKSTGMLGGQPTENVHCSDWVLAPPTNSMRRRRDLCHCSITHSRSSELQFCMLELRPMSKRNHSVPSLCHLHTKKNKHESFMVFSVISLF